MISVQLDIFSGRPNPRWKLNRRDVKQLVDRFAADPHILAPLDADVGGLGYRGFILEQINDGQDDADWKKAKLPQLARIGRQHPASAQAAHWLLHTTEHTRVAVQDHVLDVAEASIESAMPPLAYTPCSKGYYTTDTDFSFWNDPVNHPEQNNCYNYAANLRNYTFAQPGRASGSMYTQFTCSNVGAAAQRDGWQAACRTDNNLQVCLVIWPNTDFHWYRLCINSHWCHKPGSTNARNTDNSGNLITNPETCNRGSYTTFCSYYRAFNITVN